MNNEPLLEISLFGNIQTRRDGVPLTNFRHRKSLALLAYLAVTGEFHSRESLAGLLWGRATDSNALGGLRKVLAELRSEIGPYLLEQNRNVAFNQALPFDVDLLKFEQNISKALGKPAEMLDTDTNTALRLAIDLYANDFLKGFYIQRAPAFEDWVTLTRERLRLKVLDGLYLLSKSTYRQSDFQTSIRYTRRLLELEPCHEEAHRQLMSLLALTGQRKLALSQYERCRKILNDTYNLEPQNETTTLYERIRQDHVHINSGTGFNLPRPTVPLVGRQADLDALHDRLSSPNCHLLTIMGAGGSGKTHLALEYAASLVETPDTPYPDGVAFIPLAALNNIEALPSAIAYQLGFQFHKESTPIQQIGEYLSSRQMLLVLDNFEHLLQPQNAQSSAPTVETDAPRPAMLTQIRQHAPGIKILVTSRVRLDLKEEHIYPLKGIAYPSPQTNRRDFASSPAVQLFIQSAQRITPDLKGNDTNLEEIGEICQQVQGLPLGILLAAGWSSLLSPGEIAKRLALETGIDLLETESDDFPARQRSLSAVLSYSWKLLTAKEQSTLAALSIFRGSFSLSTAQQISGASLGSLRSLIDHSLLQRMQNNRYKIHEFTRQFAQQKLDDQDNMQAKYLGYYTAKFPVWSAEIKSSRQMAVIKTLDLEIDNLRAAWNMAISANNPDFLDRALETICLYYTWRHRFPEGLRLCQKLITYCQNQDFPNASIKHQRLYARGLSHLASFMPLYQAEPPLRQSLEILEKLRASGDISRDTYAALGQTSFELARTISQTGKTAEAEELLDTSIKISEELEDNYLQAVSLCILGSLLWDQSEYELSKKHITKSIKIHKELGDRRGMAASLLWLGMNTLFQGNEQGEQLVRESVAIFTETGEYDRVIDGVELAGVALMVQGKYTEARSLIEETVMASPKLLFRQASIESVLAAALTHLGHYSEASERAKAGLKRTRQSSIPFGLSFSLLVNGWLALIEDQNAQAFELFQESAEICLEHNLKDLYTWALGSQSFAAYRSGDLSAAQESLASALQTAVEIDSFIGIIISVTFGLPLVAEIGGHELAIEISSGLAQFPFIANSVYFNDFILQHIQTLAHGTSPESVKAAQTRGLELGLDGVTSKVLTLFPME